MDDLTAGVTRGAIEAAQELCKSFVKNLARTGRREIDKISIDLNVGFHNYLDRNYRKLSKIKTPLNTKNPVGLDQVFEAPNLLIDERKISSERFVDNIHETKFVVITGMGGSGKSVLLKFIYSTFYKNSKGFIPIFVELRNVPHEQGLKDYIYSQLFDAMPNFEKDMFEYALNSGKFVLLLDGMDEVDPSYSQDLAKQINSITYKYDKNYLVMTSRPDKMFDAWSEFHTAEMLGFELKQVISLITKMKYDRSIKKSFKEAVKKNLFRSHRSYLANPLLCTIMLLTFEEGAAIPVKMHIFYQRAFDVLYYKHDATKGPVFLRKFHTQLDIDEFKSVFETFCFFTYLNYGSSFSHNEALECSKKSLKYSEIKKSPSDFLHDICISVSVMLRDGDTYSYIHRSFQEYFVALFLSRREFSHWGEVVERICIDKPADSVVYLLREINLNKYQKSFLLPRLQDLREQLDSIDIYNNPSKMFNLFFVGFSVLKDGPSKSISSWTISTSTKQAPKWNYLLDRIGFFFSASKYDDESFPWYEHLDKVDNAYKSQQKRSGILEITEVADQVIVGTPLVGWLVALKEHVKDKESYLIRKFSSQNDVVLDLIGRKTKFSQID